MATYGLGACDTAGPDYGPDCVDPDYIDANGCPNDVITAYWTDGAGGGDVYPWMSSPQVYQQPRFTYEKANGKCWDYSDCYCSGCGYTFKTDLSKGYGFTGYGYYYNEEWIPFTRPFSQMTPTEKAQQCMLAMEDVGMSCPAASVNLVCFNAGGYPKKSCNSYCDSQDSSAEYTQQGTKEVMADYYGPLGISGKIPIMSHVDSTCKWNKTKTSVCFFFKFSSNPSYFTSPL